MNSRKEQIAWAMALITISILGPTTAHAESLTFKLATSGEPTSQWLIYVRDGTAKLERAAGKVMADGFEVSSEQTSEQQAHRGGMVAGDRARQPATALHSPRFALTMHPGIRDWQVDPVAHAPPAACRSGPPSFSAQSTSYLIVSGVFIWHLDRVARIRDEARPGGLAGRIVRRGTRAMMTASVRR